MAHARRSFVTWGGGGIGPTIEAVRAKLDAWIAAVKSGGPAPIPLAELVEVSRWSIRAGELARGE